MPAEETGLSRTGGRAGEEGGPSISRMRIQRWRALPPTVEHRERCHHLLLCALVSLPEGLCLPGAGLSAGVSKW